MPISGIYVSEWGINLGRHTYQSVEKTKVKGIAAYNPPSTVIRESTQSIP